MRRAANQKWKRSYEFHAKRLQVSKATHAKHNVKTVNHNHTQTHAGIVFIQARRRVDPPERRKVSRFGATIKT